MSAELSYESYDDKSLIVFGDRLKFQKQINLLGGRWNSRKEGWLIPSVNKNKLENFIASLNQGEIKQKVYRREDSESDSPSESEDIVPIEKIVSEIKAEDDVKSIHSTDRRTDDVKSIHSIDRRTDDVKSIQSIDRRREKDEHRRREEEKRMIEYRRRDEENRLRERRKRDEMKRREDELKRREDENNAKRKYGKQDPMLFNKSFKNDSDEEDNPYEYYKSFNKKPVDFRKMHNISDSESDSETVEESTEYSDTSSSDGYPSPNTPRKRDDYGKIDGKKYSELCNNIKNLQIRMSEMEIANKRRR